MFITAFRRQHLQDIQLQIQTPKDLTLFADPAYGAFLEDGDSYAVYEGDTLMVCAGVIELMPGRWQAWAMLGPDTGKIMVPLTRAVARYFASRKYKRVETCIDPNFPEAIRWAELLGFTFEGRMKKYLPNGADQLLYARVT